MDWMIPLAIWTACAGAALVGYRCGFKRGSRLIQEAWDEDRAIGRANRQMADAARVGASPHWGMGSNQEWVRKGCELDMYGRSPTRDPRIGRD